MLCTHTGKNVPERGVSHRPKGTTWEEQDNGWSGQRVRNSLMEHHQDLGVCSDGSWELSPWEVWCREVTFPGSASRRTLWMLC